VIIAGALMSIVCQAAAILQFILTSECSVMLQLRKDILVFSFVTILVDKH